jgi:hypothetical protein
MDLQTLLVIVCAALIILGGCGMHLNYRRGGK